MANVVEERGYDEGIPGPLLLRKPGALQRVLLLGDGLAEIGRPATLLEQRCHAVEDRGHELLILWRRFNVDATSA
jgi:hypothetical protein